MESWLFTGGWLLIKIWPCLGNCASNILARKEVSSLPFELEFILFVRFNFHYLAPLGSTGIVLRPLAGWSNSRTTMVSGAF
jgi:hypothetical protein